MAKKDKLQIPNSKLQKNSKLQIFPPLSSLKTTQAHAPGGRASSRAHESFRRQMGSRGRSPSPTRILHGPVKTESSQKLLFSTFDLTRKIGAEDGFFQGACAGEKSHCAFFVAIPEFHGALLAIESALHLDFLGRVGHQPHFDADFRGNGTAKLILDNLKALQGGPGRVSYERALWRGDRALDRGATVWQQFLKATGIND